METFEALYESLDRKVQDLFVRWEIHTQLFGSGEENVALLNRSGSFVFHLLQRLLLDDTILALSRLTDPPETGRKKKNTNASIKRLVDLARHSLSSTQLLEVDATLVSLERHVVNARTHRDKAIAHSDVEHALGALALPAITYAELEAAMKTLEKLMLQLGSSTIHRVGGYRPIIVFGTDGTALLKRLRESISLRGEG